jgi:hypothetical protein
LSTIAGAAIVAACVASPSGGTPTPDAGSTSTPGGASAAPTASGEVGGSPSIDPGETSTPDVVTASPGPPELACSGDDKNRDFFREAAAAMSWPVYCAVLDESWYLEGGRYRLADGGHLEVTYRGPDDAHVAIVEGTICPGGSDIDTCAPRDALIGPAAFADRQGELGRLANGLVLDLDRGATPSWRATGLGVTEDEFRTIGAALTLVDG